MSYRVIIDRISLGVSVIKLSQLFIWHCFLKTTTEDHLYRMVMALMMCSVLSQLFFGQNWDNSFLFGKGHVFNIL